MGLPVLGSGARRTSSRSAQAPLRIRAGAAGIGSVAAGAAAIAAGGHLLPSIATIPALRNRLLPTLSGRSGRRHVALTFDDGPDAASTPLILDELARLEVRASFFVLGEQLRRNPDLGRRVVAEGHELAVHGWRHRPHLLRAPWAIRADMARTQECIRALTGATPQFWRPPNGVLSGAGLLAARRLALRPVLWTADGLDWRPDATPESVLARIESQLRPGGTVLLHDSDLTSAPGSWRSALGALPGLVELCRRRGWAIGPQRDHWPA